MKTRLAIIACTLLASSLAFAEDAHDHAASAAKPPPAAEPGGMQGMHEHMKTMREQISRIRAAQDPKEKERLMNEHMKTMEGSMAKMQGMMGCGKM